jgi:hypothetical protein
MDIARYYLCESTLQIFDTAYWSGTRKRQIFDTAYWSGTRKRQIFDTAYWSGTRNRLIETSTQHELLS